MRPIGPRKMGGRWDKDELVIVQPCAHMGWIAASRQQALPCP